MKKYGLPFKGSKNTIAEKIVSILPSGGTLYDVFAGGCAVSHCAIALQKYQHYVLNDIDDVPMLFLRALRGEQFSSDWVSHEQFFASLRENVFTRTLWSFGNSSRTYIYALAIEPFKRACHEAVVHDDFNLLRVLCPQVAPSIEVLLKKAKGQSLHDRRLAFYRAMRKCLTYPALPDMGTLKRLCRLEHLERLERINSIHDSVSSIPDIVYDNHDYQQLQFTDPSGVIYCDPPYRGTDDYGGKRGKQYFNYEQFYDWCSKQTLPVFISEYEMPRDRFICVAEFRKTVNICQFSTFKATERLFRPIHQAK